MSTLFSPLQLLSVALAGWMNRYQQAVIDYLVAENQLLKEQLDGRRLQPPSSIWITESSTAAFTNRQGPCEAPFAGGA